MLKASSIAFFSLFLIACGGGSGGGSDDGAGTGGVNNPVSSEYTQTTSKSLANFQLPAVKTGVDGTDFEGVWLVKTTTEETKIIKDTDVDNELITSFTSVGLMTIISNDQSEYQVINCTESLLQNHNLELVDGKLVFNSREEGDDDLVVRDVSLSLSDGKIIGTISITDNNDYGDGHTENTQTDTDLTAVKVDDSIAIENINEVEAKIEFSGVDMSETARCVGVKNYTGNANIKRESKNVPLSGQFFMGIFEQNTNELGANFKSILVSDDRMESAVGVNDPYWSSYLSYRIASKSPLTLIDERYSYYGENPVHFITTTETFPNGNIINSETEIDKARVNPGINMYLNKADNDHVQMSGIISGDISRRATVGFKLNN